MNDCLFFGIIAKQLCALWIKKLCETLSDGNNYDGSQLTSKLIRNEYSLKLLSMLDNYDGLKFPFNERPTAEQLKPYVSNFRLYSLFLWDLILLLFPKE